MKKCHFVKIDGKLEILLKKPYFFLARCARKHDKSSLLTVSVTFNKVTKWHNFWKNVTLSKLTENWKICPKNPNFSCSLRSQKWQIDTYTPWKSLFLSILTKWRIDKKFWITSLCHLWQSDEVTTKFWYEALCQATPPPVLTSF